MTDLTVEVPLQKFGNREGFTAEMLVDNLIAQNFYMRFKHCFEPHPDWNVDVVLLKVPE